MRSLDRIAYSCGYIDGREFADWDVTTRDDISLKLREIGNDVKQIEANEVCRLKYLLGYIDGIMKVVANGKA